MITLNQFLILLALHAISSTGLPTTQLNASNVTTQFNTSDAIVDGQVAFLVTLVGNGTLADWPTLQQVLGNLSESSTSQSSAAPQTTDVPLSTTDQAVVTTTPPSVPPSTPPPSPLVPPPQAPTPTTTPVVPPQGGPHPPTDF
ncbi:hypothetical protein C8R43DRAFT_439946 [Mycena crocata]|nr:hypothetical protein C8R43DRAFT_439946 [Mycena crocata]